MFDEVKSEEQVIFSYIGDKEDYAILSVEQIYELNKSETLKKWCGTDDSRQPGVSYIGNKGKYAIGGKIQSLQNSFNISGSSFSVMVVKPFISEKNTVRFFLLVLILTSSSPVKIELYTWGEKYFDSFARIISLSFVSVISVP